MERVSTRQAAKRLGISLMTLQRYIAAKKLASVPKVERVGGSLMRLWSELDIKRVRKEMSQAKDGRKKRK
jgi:excisionase family DNA binding protein